MTFPTLGVTLKHGPVVGSLCGLPACPCCPTSLAGGHLWQSPVHAGGLLGGIALLPCGSAANQRAVRGYFFVGDGGVAVANVGEPLWSYTKRGVSTPATQEGAGGSHALVTEGLL